MFLDASIEWEGMVVIETGVVLVEGKGEGIAEMCFGGSSGRSC